MYRTRREMDERAERRGREEMFHRHHDYAQTRTTDAVTNAFAHISLELADIRGEIEELRLGIDQEGGLESVRSELDELSRRVDDVAA